MNEPHLIRYMKKVHDLSERFKTFETKHMPREQNFRAYMLSKLSSPKKTGFNHIIIQERLVIHNIEVREINIINIIVTSS